MVIRYCAHCAGQPYTNNMQVQAYPRCGKPLGIESVDETTLDDRPMLNIPSDGGDDGDFPEQPAGVSGEPPVPQTDNPWTKPATKKQGNVPAKQHSGPILPAFSRNAGSGNCIRGKVFQYSSTGKEDGSYRRFPWTKPIDANVYKQRFEDVLHRFYVRVDGEKDAFGNVTYRDVSVNVHGTIAGGMQIADNSIVEVEGKFQNGTLMAERVYIVNSGFRSQVKFQHSPRAIFYGLVAIAALIFMIAIGVGGSGSFFENIGLFLESWLVIAIALSVLYLISMFTRMGLIIRLLGGKQKGFPLTGIAVISMLLAMVCSNSFGLGNIVGGAVSSALGSVLPIVFFIVIIVVIFKMFF